MKPEFLRSILYLGFLGLHGGTSHSLHPAFTSSLMSRTFSRCPPEDEILPCICDLKGIAIQVRCENSEIEKVGIALEVMKRRKLSVEELYLVANRIPVIPARFFGSLELNKLFLMSNEMVSISRNAFAGLEAALKHIFIREPTLKDIPFDTFDNLRELRTINLENTSVSLIPGLFSLPHLEFLKIDRSRVSEITPDSFRVMPSMRKIHITNSNLTVLTENSMEGLIHLKEIDFSENNINWVHPGAFRNLEMVEQISISGNKIEDAATAVMAARELKSLKIMKIGNNNIRFLMRGTFVDMPNLEEVDLSHNFLERIDQEAMYKLPNLKKLDLSNNNIYHFESNVFTDVPSLEHLNLGNNNLSFIEDMKYIYRSLPNLKILDLSANFLRGGSEYSFGGHSKLEILVLNKNFLTKLNKNLFKSLPNLKQLHLNQNHIKRNTDNLVWELPKLLLLDLSRNDLTNIDGNLFAGLPKLTDLLLNFNLITEISTKAFHEVPFLKGLNMSHNKLAKLHPSTFKNVPDLYELDMNFNILGSITKGLFDGLSSLEILHVAHNHIMKVEQNAFDDTVKLKVLDLSFNLLKDVPTNAIRKLSSLRELNFHKNAISRIRRGSFDQLRIVEALDLSQNHIQNLETGAFSRMDLLRNLDLSVNYIQSLPPKMFEDMKLIEKMNISHNFITKIGSEAFKEVKRLRILDMTNNSITSLGESIHDFPSLQGLFLNDNYITTLTNNTFINLPSLSVLFFKNNGLQNFETGTFYNLSSLIYLDLTNNNLAELGSYSFSSLRALKEIKIAQNQIASIKNYAFMNLQSLQSIELQDNAITKLEDFAFDKLPSIKFLNLSGNGMQEIPEKALLKVPSLDVLDLSWNYIMEVKDSSFKELQWLTVLLLHNNDLCHLSPNAFSGPRSLRVLMLHNNQLKRLHLSALRDPIQSLSLLDMGGNPFICDCELIWLRDYLQQEEDRIIHRLERVRDYYGRQPQLGSGRNLFPSFPSPVHSQPTCAGPPEYAGTLITEVPPEAFFCSSGFRQRSEKCVPRFIDPQLLAEGNSVNGLSPDVLNTLLKLSNLSDILPGDDGGPSYLDYKNPIVLSGLSELISNYSKYQDSHKEKIPTSKGEAILRPPVVGKLPVSSEKTPSLEKLNSDFVTGDTPTIYAGLPSNQEQTDKEKPTNTGGLFGFRLPALPSILDTIGRFRLPDLGLNVDWASLPFRRFEEGKAPNIETVAPVLHHLQTSGRPNSVPGKWVEVSPLSETVATGPKTQYTTQEIGSEEIHVKPPLSSGRGNNTNRGKFYNVYSEHLTNMEVKRANSSLTRYPIPFAEPFPEDSREKDHNYEINQPYTHAPYQSPMFTIGPGPGSGTPFLPGVVNNRPRPLPYIPNRTFYSSREKEKDIKTSEIRGLVPKSPSMKFPQDGDKSKVWSWSPTDSNTPSSDPSLYSPGSSYNPMEGLKNPIVVVDGPNDLSMLTTHSPILFENPSTIRPLPFDPDEIKDDKEPIPLKDNFQTIQNSPRDSVTTVRSTILEQWEENGNRLSEEYTTTKQDTSLNQQNGVHSVVSTTPNQHTTSSPYDDWTKSFIDSNDYTSPTTQQSYETSTRTSSYMNEENGFLSNTEKPIDVTEEFIPVSLLPNFAPGDKNSSSFSPGSDLLILDNQTSTFYTTSSFPIVIYPEKNFTISDDTSGTTDSSFMRPLEYTTLPPKWLPPTQSSNESLQINNVVNGEANLYNNPRDPNWWPPSSLGEGVTLVQGSHGHTNLQHFGLVEQVDKSQIISHGVKHVSPSRSIGLRDGILIVEKIDNPIDTTTFQQPQEEIELITEAPSPRRKEAGMMDWYYSNYNREYDPNRPLPVGGNAPPDNGSLSLQNNIEMLLGSFLCCMLQIFIIHKIPTYIS